MDLTEKIENQRKKINDGNPVINLFDSCRIGNGISALNKEDILTLADSFDQIKSNLDLCFFTPASGSGSRMFKRFFDFLNFPVADRQDSHKNLDRQMTLDIQKLAISSLLSSELKDKLNQAENVDSEEVVNEFIDSNKLNLAAQPKGLIPFHIYKDCILNAFQEHSIQSELIGGKKSTIHFTINTEFHSEISGSLKKCGSKLSSSFSEQDSETDSIAFDKNTKAAVNSNGDLIRRPAGHGTLIHNLNNINADIIFIRNIDNMQHQDKAATSTITRKALGAKLIEFKTEVDNVLSKIARDHAFESSIKTLNERFDLRFSENDMSSPTAAFEALNRPLRICGMVKNEGEPGGGPFWVKDEEEKLSRQIIEKSQMSDDSAQLKLMETATHFNPVELFCSVRDFKGDKFDLTNFVNNEHYFIVNKSQEGQDITYIEQPGLWNGAMANWLTLFYEIDSDCFSPVKAVTDLLKPLHLKG